jgi:hypothetical protein
LARSWAALVTRSIERDIVAGGVVVRRREVA